MNSFVTFNLVFAFALLAGMGVYVYYHEAGHMMIGNLFGCTEGHFVLFGSDGWGRYDCDVELNRSQALVVGELSAQARHETVGYHTQVFLVDLFLCVYVFGTALFLACRGDKL